MMTVQLGVLTELQTNEINSSRPMAVRLMQKRIVSVKSEAIQGPTDSLNTKHRVTFSAMCNGHVRLQRSFETTKALRVTDSADIWQRELEALTQIGTGNVLVTKPSTLIYEIEWIGDFATKFVRSLSLLNETYKTSYLSGYWLTNETIYASWPSGSTWLSQAQMTPGHKTYTLVSKGQGLTSGTYTIYVRDGTYSQTISSVIVPFDATPSQVQTLLNADSKIGAGGCSVIGDRLTEGQMQIDMLNAKFIVKLATSDTTIEIIPSGRTVQVAKDGQFGWLLTGASWNY